MQNKNIMKKLLLITFILLPAFIKAQQYVPFPDSNAVWSEYCSQWEEYYPPPYPYYYRYILKNNDTLVNSKTYHTIFYSLIDSSFYSTDTSLKYAGGIRESNKILYYLPKDSTTEYILYDFSKHKGDTIVYKYSVFAQYYGEWPVDTLIITNTDSIQLLDGTYRMRDSLEFLNNGYTSPCFDFLWIEGIGSTWGLLTPVGDIPTKDLDGRHSLLCFKKDTDIIYHVGNNNDCYPITNSINEVAENNLKCSVYPNPFSTETTLEIDKTFKDAILTVYNSFGQNVKLIKNISGQTMTLHRDNLPGGLYFIQLVQDNKTFATDKIIIIDN